MQQGLGAKCVHNRWAYATYTLLPMHEIGQNQRKKGGWAYITSWAYITYSTVLVFRGITYLSKTSFPGVFQQEEDSNRSLFAKTLQNVRLVHTFTTVIFSKMGALIGKSVLLPSGSQYGLASCNFSSHSE